MYKVRRFLYFSSFSVYQYLIMLGQIAVHDEIISCGRRAAFRPNVVDEVSPRLRAGS
jgi:hypothetical protein